VVTVRGQGELIREHLPEIPVKNIFEEPLARNTAPCIGFAAIHLKQIDPAAVMVVLPADHYIEEAGRFLQALTFGMEVAQKGFQPGGSSPEGHLATLGIVPDYPATGYGYIAAGDVLSGSQDAIKAYRVEHFTEKPSLSRAKTFLEKGNYYWNSGVFIWKVERILEEIARHMPGLYSGLKEIEKHWETPNSEQVVTEVYKGQKATSIDHGVMEKASRIAVIPVEMGWNDLGDWNSLSSVLEKDADGNVIRAKHIGIDTKDSTVFSLQDRLIATIGLENVVIVDTPEALLVMDRKRAQEIKEIVVKLKMESKAASTSE
jgi:mannose-1-phosphate guanylyltransferase